MVRFRVRSIEAETCCLRMRRPRAVELVAPNAQPRVVYVYDRDAKPDEELAERTHASAASTSSTSSRPTSPSQVRLRARPAIADTADDALRSEAAKWIQRISRGRHARRAQQQRGADDDRVTSLQRGRPAPVLVSPSRRFAPTHFIQHAQRKLSRVRPKPPSPKEKTDARF